MKKNSKISKVAKIAKVSKKSKVSKKVMAWGLFSLEGNFNGAFSTRTQARLAKQDIRIFMGETLHVKKIEIRVFK